VATVRRTILAGVALLAAGVLAAPAAQAGQVVWLASGVPGGGELRAANDDGTYQHRLIGAADAPLVAEIAGGALGDPDVFQKGGSAVIFTDATSTASPLCALPCARAFSLTAGALAVQSPAPVSSGAGFESQPRLTATESLVEQYVLYPSATASTLGAPSVAGLFQRPLGSSAFGTPWSDSATATLAQRADPTPDPANPSLLAWVEIQDPSCTRFTVDDAAVCQYAVRVGTASTTAPPVAIFDDEAPFGPGPSSLAFSTDGRTLLIVDDAPPNDGIYEVPASTAVSPAAKHVTEVLAEPPGWTFGTARFAGTKIVFDAHGEGHSLPATSDIYTISASCDSGTCSFPASATNLTRKPTADNVDPAWTSATAPLVALGTPAPVPGAPPTLHAAAIVARTVTSKKGVAFTVTLSVAGPLNVSISRGGHTIGTTTVRLPAGESTFTLRNSGGHALTPGHDVAKLRVGSSTAVNYSASFTVTH
jgi:hypothetical protein